MIQNLIFPKLCINCSKPGSYLCAKCFKTRCKPNLIQKCHVCGKEVRLGLVHSECKELNYIDGVISVTKYNKILRKIITMAKYNFYYSTMHDIANIMNQYLYNYRYTLNNSTITSVPLHKKKKLTRGFNQAEILAERIARKFNLHHIEIIDRVRNTKTQVGMAKSQREINLKKAFTLNKDIMNKYKLKTGLLSKIVIVDDIYTTGTTLNECAGVLKKAGFNKIYGLVFAKRGE